MTNLPVDQVIKLYQQGYTLQELCVKFNRKDRQTFAKLLRKSGVTLRSRSESIQLTYKNKTVQYPDRTKENNTQWKGGIKRDKYGYILVHRPEHPQANSQGYVRKHRLVMEAHLGRPLTKREVVHHKDGDKSNNEISNLQLMADHSSHAQLENAKRTRDNLGRYI